MRGGKRKGAGRKAGSPNKKTAARKAAIAASGEMPADYMLRIVRDKTADNDRRDRMAIAAAPYFHSRAIEHTGKGGGAIVVNITGTDADL